MKKAMIDRLSALAAALVVALAGGCLSFDIESDEAPSDITVKELLKRMDNARDPDGIFDKAGSYVQKQIQTDQHGEKKLCIVRYLAPDCLRSTIFYDNQPEQELILNGNSGWRVDYVKRTVTQLSAEVLSMLQTLFQLDNPDGSDYLALFEEVELTRCRIGDEDLYKLVCRPRDTKDYGFAVYVGNSSYLTRRLRIIAPDDKVLEEAIIDRYALFEGVMMPETTRQIGLVESSSKVIETRLNVEMKRDDFLPPVFPQITDSEDKD